MRLSGPWADVTLDSLAETTARARPDRVLFTDASDAAAWGDRPATALTGAALQQGAARLARMLLTLGLRRGDAVIVMMPNHTDTIVTLIGALAAGLRPVPIPVVSTEDEARRAVDAVGARAIMTVTRYGDLAPALVARDVAAACFTIRFVCAFGTRPPEGVVTLHGWRDDELRAEVSRASAAGDPAITTLDWAGGGPVPFQRSHAQWIADGLALAALAGLSVRPQLIATTGPVTAASIVATLIAPLVSGVATQLVGPYDSDLLSSLLAGAPDAIVTVPGSLEAAIAAELDGLLGDRIALVRQPRTAETCAPHRAVDLLSLGEAALWPRLRSAGDGGEIPISYRHPVGTAMPRSEPYLQAAISARGRLLLSGFGVARPLSTAKAAGPLAALDTGLVVHAAGADHLALADTQTPLDEDADLFTAGGRSRAA
jgi:non-ribosomal peptide synthetase component F